MATRRLWCHGGWLLALVAVAGCGNGSNAPKDMAPGGGDLADGGSSGPTVGGVVSGLAGSGLILQNNGGDDLTPSANGAFTFATALADGATYDVSIKTQPSSPAQLCAVANGQGTITGGTSVSSVVVTCVAPTRFVLVADGSDNSVGSFALDASSGRLRYAGKTATGKQPVSIATDPLGHFAWVANAGDGNLSQFNIDANGQLQPLAPATVSAGAGLRAVAVDATAAHAYAATTGGIAQYGVGADGTLTALSPATVGAGSGPAAIAVDPSGRFAYVANAGDGTVSQFSVGADGTLTALATPTVAAGMAPSGIAVDPSGSFVYVTNGGDKTVSQYSIGSGGALTPLATATVPAGTGATSPVIDASDKLAYVVNGGDKTVSQYSIGSGGALTPLGTATAPAGTGAAAVVVDGSDRYAFVANGGDGNIAQYTLGTGGALAANAPATVPGQLAPSALALVGGKGAAQPVASHAYVTDNNGSVHDFPVAADGTLGTPATIAATGHHPASIVLDAAGTHAYVLDNDELGGNGNILQYAVSATGAWTALSPASVAAGASPTSIVLHPSGRFAYLANSKNSADTLSQFAVAADGTLTPLATATVDTASEPLAIAIDPTGRFAYVTTNGNGVVEYTVGADGTLTVVGTPPTSTIEPGGIAIDPTGRAVYVTDASTTTVLQYAIDATNGHLTPMSVPSVPSGAGPQIVAAAPSARSAYAVDGSACTRSQYAVGSDGSLSPLSPATVGAGNCTAMDSVVFVAVDPSSRFVYVPDNGTSSSSVLQYGIGTGGALAPLTPAATSALSGAALMQIAFLVRYQ